MATIQPIQPEVKTKHKQVNCEQIKSYLENKVLHFKAGCIAKHLKTWASLTSDYEILSTVKGMPIDFDKMPLQQLNKLCSNNTFNAEEMAHIDKEIDKLLKKGFLLSQNPNRVNLFHQFSFDQKVMALFASSLISKS